CAISGDRQLEFDYW
nr:immunoglobulin heavy chain junction region [Macaca mulatta]MOV87689.1 immunoglobulin heavy chain junction region [Macaca mulatta]MOV87951.1 immunoglobulin heavy chain junction region [Macaca mulatta]MOV88804.1 immunoglobulin heavy chain junction region [Macaca mulatta]MOV88921.1 immunoglobulin heavy chain junction region [Macaca mulatta]